MIEKPTKKRRKKRVKEPLTDELLDELLSAPNPRAFTSGHRLTSRDLPTYLNQLLDEHGLTRAGVIRAAGLNETFGYQIFVGQRGASRDKVLQLAFAMQLTLKEANRLLQAAGANELYCKRRRDAIIIFCLTHGYSLQKTDEELYRFGEETIC
ncbi:XRE family transcriptional regulator [Adlercreutzia sp. ZJ305]|uniref:XRE family transcriptional regulator n=1 Tax=Adlercreutzia sp. ZJ305 TaxID=2709408 RepID=UPI001F155CF0|nr:XRE family transcriptional regulator [Adlercreutzia sp. ZJ305]